MCAGAVLQHCWPRCGICCTATFPPDSQVTPGDVLILTYSFNLMLRLVYLIPRELLWPVCYTEWVGTIFIIKKKNKELIELLCHGFFISECHLYTLVIQPSHNSWYFLPLSIYITFFAVSTSIHYKVLLKFFFSPLNFLFTFDLTCFMAILVLVWVTFLFLSIDLLPSFAQC